MGALWPARRRWLSAKHFGAAGLAEIDEIPTRPPWPGRMRKWKNREPISWAMNTYGHILKEMRQEAARQTDAVFSRLAVKLRRPAIMCAACENCLMREILTPVSAEVR